MSTDQCARPLGYYLCGQASHMAIEWWLFPARPLFPACGTCGAPGSAPAARKSSRHGDRLWCCMLMGLLCLWVDVVLHGDGFGSLPPPRHTWPAQVDGRTPPHTAPGRQWRRRVMDTPQRLGGRANPNQRAGLRTGGPPEPWGGAAVTALSQTCHGRLAGKLVLSRNRPRIKRHSVIPAPRTTRTQ